MQENIDAKNDRKFERIKIDQNEVLERSKTPKVVQHPHLQKRSRRTCRSYRCKRSESSSNDMSVKKVHFPKPSRDKVAPWVDLWDSCEIENLSNKHVFEVGWHLDPPQNGLQERVFKHDKQ